MRKIGFFATLFIAIVVFASPAYAVGSLTSASVTATGTIATSGTNAYPITITGTTTSSTQGTDTVRVRMSSGISGWTFVTPLSSSSCPGWLTITGITATSCTAYPSGGSTVLIITASADIASGTVISVTYGANSLNVSNGRTFELSTLIGTTNPLTEVDSAIVTLAGGNAPAPAPAPNPVVTPTEQTLANTGFDGTPYLLVGTALTFTGGLVLLIARRKQNN